MLINLNKYSQAHYRKVVAAEVESGHLPQDRAEIMLEKAMFFVNVNTDESGFNGHWTKAQTYIALGNALHTAARLEIDATPLEGIDSELISEIFKEELDGYVCDVALALGYHLENEDYNKKLPKARLALSDVVTVI